MLELQGIGIKYGVVVSSNSSGRNFSMLIKSSPVDRVCIVFKFKKATYPIKIDLTFYDASTRDNFQRGEFYSENQDKKVYLYCFNKDPHFERCYVFNCNEIEFAFGFNEEIDMEMDIAITNNLPFNEPINAFV